MSSTKCPLCQETFSVLRHATVCDFCRRNICSTCCHPSAVDTTRRICLFCIRQQQKKVDSNDDRPKWLREAQELRKAQPNQSSDPGVNPVLFPSPSASGPSGSGHQQRKSTSNIYDDRPKWLREAQEMRAEFGSQSSDAVLVSPGTTALEDRLARLKEDPVISGKIIATEEDLHSRLARLRGVSNPVPRTSDHSVLIPQKPMSEAEEIKSLITQMRDRVNLGDEDVDLIKELEMRLERLKEETAKLGIKHSDFKPDTSGERMQVDVDSDEEEERIRRMLPEFEKEDLKNGDEEEIDFCVICPDEPEVICRDCDGDKYCLRCFRECHREWAATDHRSRPIRKS